MSTSRELETRKLKNEVEKAQKREQKSQSLALTSVLMKWVSLASFPENIIDPAQISSIKSWIKNWLFAVVDDKLHWEWTKEFTTIVDSIKNLNEWKKEFIIAFLSWIDSQFNVLKSGVDIN